MAGHLSASEATKKKHPIHCATLSGISGHTTCNNSALFPPLFFILAPQPERTSSIPSPCDKT